MRVKLPGQEFQLISDLVAAHWKQTALRPGVPAEREQRGGDREEEAMVAYECQHCVVSSC